MDGFLGTGATLRADITLIVQLGMGSMLLVGMLLARRKRFRAHKLCQSSVMLLNLIMIAVVMSPSFHVQVQPQLPTGLRDSYYLVATVHAGLGTIAELMGLYIVLAAATNILPQAIRLKRFKPWMRAELALWWVVVLFGVGTYYAWYVAPSSKVEARQTSLPAGQGDASSERVTVVITNFQFEPKQVTIPEGTTVEWLDSTGRHTVEADDGTFNSGPLVAGGRFEHTFDRPGAFPYFCGFHGDRGGMEMAGTITVVPKK